MNYLIPADTKKGQLILGLFRPFDLILFLSGVMVTVILLAFLPLTNTWLTILIISPAVICGFLVMPVPYYHNILNIIVEMYDYFSNTQTYHWKGWCFMNEKENRRK